jgi:multidrug efflux pump subunit AcrB
MSGDGRLGLSGAIARRFLTTEITPLLAVIGLLLGLFAVVVTPREEEPQIDVTFANVFIAYPGATAREVELLVATPAEQILSEIEGVEHIYSASQPGLAVLTVQFEVGQPRTEAIVRLYNAFYSKQDWLPPSLGVGQPLIKPKGIDDVPIVALTLWSEDPRLGGDELARVAHALETELQRVPGTRDIYSLGAPERMLRVLLDPQRLAGYGLALDDLRHALGGANAAADAGSLVRDNREVLVQAGTFLVAPEEVGELVVGMREGAPVYLRDVAELRYGAAQPENYVRFSGDAAGLQPAVTIAIAKKPGTNAVEVAELLLARLEALRGQVLPESVNVTVTRNYGVTADDKAQTLIKKLAFATASVVLLVLFALGRREAFVVGAAVVVTLAITLFASWAWGFTLNRVSLFALIFSIGILVDDAIVVVENIHRHLQQGGRSLTEAIPMAVDEVGGPTILATFTVIAALLPMAFVSGLMGPYMAPIPINASMGMLISLLVAFVFTPWLYRRVFLRVAHAQHAAEDEAQAGRLQRFFERRMTPFLRREAGEGHRRRLLLVLIALILLSLGLAGLRLVVMKMLPFDNKSEFQVVVDMPEGTPLEETQRALDELAALLAAVPEVTDVQTYAGTSAPINFNGLVRQYYLRRLPHQGDIQVNLRGRRERERQSHEVALAVRAPLQAAGRTLNANVKVIEVPPGPPVLAPLVAEIYGPDHAYREQTATKVRAIFESTRDIVDVDDTLEAPQSRIIVAVDRSRAARLGISQQAVATALATAVGGEDISWLHGENAKHPVPVRLELASGDKADLDTVRALRVRSETGALVALGEIAEFRMSTREQTIHHKDLLPLMYVTGDMAGRLDSPLYGMAAIAGRLAELPGVGGEPFRQYLTRQPDVPYASAMKWDGEWQITYETFRDMGLAYSVGLVLIYLLVVAQFRSYGVPLIIMAPIPLTLIGIMPGHALLMKQFTATSMIGMIALAGIIVRNSILLVDFIQQEVRRGRDLQEAVIAAAAVRARPIALTAVAAMLGAFFILDDPIFSGLAVSLIFGIFVSTLLTLLVIPVVYYAHHYRKTPPPEELH